MPSPEPQNNDVETGVGELNQAQQGEPARDNTVTRPSQVSAAFVLIKPDAVERGLTGAVLDRLARARLHLVARKWVIVTPELAERHYEMKDRSHKRRYAPLAYAKQYLVYRRVLAMVWSGPQALSRIRQVVGDGSDPASCKAGTVRRDFGVDTLEKAESERRAVRNLIHASRSISSATREIELWFPELNGSPEK